MDENDYLAQALRLGSTGTGQPMADGGMGSFQLPSPQLSVQPTVPAPMSFKPIEAPPAPSPSPGRTPPAFELPDQVMPGREETAVLLGQTSPIRMPSGGPGATIELPDQVITPSRGLAEPSPAFTALNLTRPTLSVRPQEQPEALAMGVTGGRPELSTATSSLAPSDEQKKQAFKQSADAVKRVSTPIEIAPTVFAKTEEGAREALAEQAEGKQAGSEYIQSVQDRMYHQDIVMSSLDNLQADLTKIDTRSIDGKAMRDKMIGEAASGIQEAKLRGEQANAERMAAEAAQFPEDVRKQLEANAKREGEAQDQIRDATEKMAQSHYDEGRFWKKIGVGGSILAAISMAMGEYARIRTGGNTNAAMQLINGAINRDIEAQREEYARLGDKVKEAKGLYAEMRQRGATDLQAISVMRAAALDASAAKTNEIASQSKIAETRLAGIALGAGIDDAAQVEKLRSAAAANQARISAEQKAFENGLKLREADRKDVEAQAALTTAEARVLGVQQAGESKETKAAREQAERTVVNPFNPKETVTAQPREARDFRNTAARVASLDQDLAKVEQVMAMPTVQKAGAAVQSLFGGNDNYAAALVRLKGSLGGAAKAFGDPATNAAMKRFDEAVGGVWKPGAEGAVRGLRQSMRGMLDDRYKSLAGTLTLPKP